MTDRHKYKTDIPRNHYFKRCLRLLSVFALLFCIGFDKPAQAQFRAFNGSSSASSDPATSGPNLMAVEAQINAGSLTVGSTSFVVVLFRNNGIAPVEVGSVNLYPSSTVSASVSLNQCSREPLPPGADCAMTVAVSGLQPGSYRIEMLVDHNGRTRLATSSIEGTVDPTGDQQQQAAQTELEAFPEVLEFGQITTGVEQVRSVTFRNRTSEVISVRDIFLEASEKSGFNFETNCNDLPAGAACLVTVGWSPSQVGNTNGSLVILHSGISGITRLDISGEYAPSAPSDAPIYPDAVPNLGLLIADRSQFEFGSDVESVSAITASMVNAGDKSLTIQSIRLSGSESGLSIARSGCKSGAVLDPGAACPLTISWAPSREGPVLDDVQIRHTGARGILIIPVRGEAQSAVTRDAVAVRTSINDQDDDEIELTPVLDGYIVTSLSPKNAVISAPVGTLIVRDQEDVLIAGVKWKVNILSNGVELQGSNDTILLVFDRTLTPNRFSSSTSDEGGTNDDN